MKALRHRQGLLLGIAVLLLALWWLRAPLAEHMLPRSATERLLVQAEAALAHGRLSADDGSGALQRFHAVLARDPDRAAARAGLEQVARAALVRAEQRLADADQAAALALLEVARAAGAPGAQVDALLQRVHSRQSSEAVLMHLLDVARRAQAQGNLDGGSDSALAQFNEILERDPGNVLALAGRDGVLAGLLAQAQARLAVGDSASALAVIERVNAVAPRHLGLPATRAALAQHLGDLPAQAALHRAAVAAALQRGQLDAAQSVFDALPDVQPDDPLLRREIASAWARRAIVEAVRGRTRASQSARQHLTALAGDTEQRGLIVLLDARAQHWQLRRVGEPVERQWAVLFAALQGDGQAAAISSQRHCFEQALAAIALARAATCLEALAALAPRADADQADRTRLARVYLGVAEERLGRGDIEEARQAAYVAQLLNPGDAGLAPLFVRLGQLAR